MGLLPFLIASIVGAGAMYYLDPNTGARRRSLLRDQLVKFSNTASERAENFSERAGDKVQGAVAEASRHLEHERVPNETLVARVRSEMGRYVSHPHAVDVTANSGVVTLTGNILSQEVQPFVSKVYTIPGVNHVDNRLQVHENVEGVPDVQGGVTRTELQ
jgi:osmotically-inducible protein OsmY